MAYGIPYLGSKNIYAKKILEALPPGERLVDLFAGGCAVTDCALRHFSHKWRSFLVNDIDDRPLKLYAQCIRGENPIPHAWLSHEAFKTASWVDRLIWSYNGKMRTYMYAKGKEDFKHAAFDYVVSGERRGEFAEFPPLEGGSLWQRYQNAKKHFREKRGERFDLESVENILRCESLEHYIRMSGLEMSGLEMSGLEMTSCSYLDFKPRKGDVIYCDPPYDNTAQKQYVTPFDSKAFWEWAHNLPVDVYVSERTIPPYAEVIFEYKYLNRFPQISNTYKTEYLVKV